MQKDFEMLRALYPELTEEQLHEADENVKNYLDLILRIYERVQSDPDSYTRFRNLTREAGTLPCTPPRSNPLIDDNANHKT